MNRISIRPLKKSDSCLRAEQRLCHFPLKKHYERPDTGWRFPSLPAYGKNGATAASSPALPAGFAPGPAFSWRSSGGR
jgi:hypothetical protein